MHLGCRHTHPMVPRDVSLCAVTAAMQATQINLGCAFHHVDAELLHIRYQIIQRHTLPVVVFSALSLFSSAAQARCAGIYTRASDGFEAALTYDYHSIVTMQPWPPLSYPLRCSAVPLLFRLSPVPPRRVSSAFCGQAASVGIREDMISKIYA